MKTTLYPAVLLSLAADALCQTGGGDGTVAQEDPPAAAPVTQTSEADPAEAEVAGKIAQSDNQAKQPDGPPEEDAYDAFDRITKTGRIRPGVLVLIGTPVKEGAQPNPVVLVQVQSIAWVQTGETDWSVCLNGEMLSRFLPLEAQVYEDRVMPIRQPVYQTLAMTAIQTTEVRMVVTDALKVSLVGVNEVATKRNW